MQLPYSYIRQIRSVLLIEVLIFGAYCLLFSYIWQNICGGELSQCFSPGSSFGVFTILLLSLLRPFLLTPFTFMILIIGNHYSFGVSILLTILSIVCSLGSVYVMGKLIGKKLVNPWVKSNLPNTYHFLRSQDFKITILCRLVPFFHFDIFSLLFGVFDFRFKSVLIGSILGELPLTILFIAIASGSDFSAMTLTKIAFFAVLFVLVIVSIIEFVSRLRGSGLYQATMAMYQEIIYEAKLNNEIVKRYTINPDKTPVLLLYGFFSSRRTLTIVERLLNARGYDVVSFNLGGLFGVFFTKGIIETAKFIDEKLKRQFNRKNFKDIHIVAHSKGGLVALWWLLKMGGHNYCKKVICMGTPFKGNPLTYLGIVTPLGYIWKDIWQMRPGSRFLKYLHSLPIPEELDIYCLYSKRDRVSTDTKGKYEPIPPSKNVHYIPCHEFSHFEYLYKREIADIIDDILNPATNSRGGENVDNDTDNTDKDSPQTQLRIVGSE